MSLVEPMIPAAEHSGRPRHVNMREVLNAIFYVLSTGRQRRTLPNAAQKYGALLPHAVGLGWHVGAHPPRTAWITYRIFRTFGIDGFF